MCLHIVLSIMLFILLSTLWPLAYSISLSAQASHSQGKGTPGLQTYLSTDQSILPCSTGPVRTRVYHPGAPHLSVLQLLWACGRVQDEEWIISVLNVVICFAWCIGVTHVCCMRMTSIFGSEVIYCTAKMCCVVKMYRYMYPIVVP